MALADSQNQNLEYPETAITNTAGSHHCCILADEMLTADLKRRMCFYSFDTEGIFHG